MLDLSKIPPNPSLEKGGEGGISGSAWLQKSALWAGVLLSQFVIFQFVRNPHP
jgi:hypothetical protein